MPVYQLIGTSIEASNLHHFSPVIDANVTFPTGLVSLKPSVTPEVANLITTPDHNHPCGAALSITCDFAEFEIVGNDDVPLCSVRSRLSICMPQSG